MRDYAGKFSERLKLKAKKPQACAQALGVSGDSATQMLNIFTKTMHGITARQQAKRHDRNHDKQYSFQHCSRNPMRQLMQRKSRQGLACRSFRQRYVAIAYLTRETYSPERVSTRTTSPICTNNGTLTTAPVLRVAGLPPVPAVSPFRPGSVSVISASMKFGG